MYEFILNILHNFDTRFSQLNRQEGNRNGDVAMILWWCIKMFSACASDVLVIFKGCVGDVLGVSR